MLRLVAVSSLFAGTCYLSGAILNVLYRVRTLLVVNAAGTVAVLGGVKLELMHHPSLASAGWGWLGGWAVFALMFGFAALYALSRTPSTTLTRRGAIES